jgi:hypothetical protein
LARFGNGAFGGAGGVCAAAEVVVAAAAGAVDGGDAVADVCASTPGTATTNARRPVARRTEHDLDGMNTLHAAEGY